MEAVGPLAAKWSSCGQANGQGRSDEWRRLKNRWTVECGKWEHWRTLENSEERCGQLKQVRLDNGDGSIFHCAPLYPPLSCDTLRNLISSDGYRRSYALRDWLLASSQNFGCPFCWKSLLTKISWPKRSLLSERSVPTTHFAIKPTSLLGRSIPIALPVADGQLWPKFNESFGFQSSGFQSFGFRWSDEWVMINHCQK